MALSRVALLLLGLAFACATEDRVDPVDRVLVYQNDATTAARLELGGVTVEVQPPLTAHLSILSRSFTGSTTTNLEVNSEAIPATEREFGQGCRVWLRGERLAVEGGQLTIGAHSHGAVSAGARITIDELGVHVEGP